MMNCNKCRVSLSENNTPSYKVKGVKKYRKVCKNCYNKKQREWKKKNRENNREKLARKQREYYARKRDVMLAANREWKRNNPEKYKMSVKKSNEKNKGSISARYYEIVRKAKRDNVRVGFTKEEFFTYMQNARCYATGVDLGPGSAAWKQRPWAYSLDRQLPGKQGGAYTLENVKPCRYEENQIREVAGLSPEGLVELLRGRTIEKIEIKARKKKERKEKVKKVISIVIKGFNLIKIFLIGGK